MEIIGAIIFLLVLSTLAYTRIGHYSPGSTGEALVRQHLVYYCSKTGAHLLNNITLRLNDGSTTQIDHILISTRGVFVIETKHYSGWIFASAKSKVWTQTIYHMKSTFQNPLLQNYRHVKAVTDILDFLHPSQIHNIVVFTGNAEFKTEMPYNVLYLQDLIPSIDALGDIRLSVNRVQFCIGRLEYERMKLTKQTDLEHHANLTKRFGDY